MDEHSYLQAWCRSAEGVRLFRLDRIDAATERDEPSTPPDRAVGGDDALDLFHDDPSLPVARLLVRPDHIWLLDYYPMVRVLDHADGSVEVTMRFATLDWMSRLAIGLGSGVTVLGPDELVEAVTERSRAALAAYRQAREAADEH